MILTASVVLYNTRQELFDSLLKSVIESNCVSKLYVIDNSPEKHPDLFCKWENIEYIPNNNIGYGSSHNIAMHKACDLSADYHLVLNPDIRFERNVLPELSSFMEKNKEVVYVLPKVIYPSGEVQALCKLLPTPSDLIFRRFIPSIGPFKIWKQKKNAHYELIHSGYDKILNPPCLSGCFMFMRCSALRESNTFFDDRFFMYFEDFDLIRRLHRIGRTVFYPKVVIIHDHEKGSYKSKKLLKVHIRSAIKYFNKYGWIFDKERSVQNRLILSEIEDMKI